MSTPVRSIIRSCLRKDEPLNIVSFDCPEYYLLLLNELGHNIYIWDNFWRNPFCTKPKNIHLLPQPEIPIDIDVDLAICNSPHNVMNVIQFCHFWHVPVINVIHNLCNLARNHQWWKVKDIFGDTKVFTSTTIRDSWQDYGYIIEPQFNWVDNPRELVVIPTPQNPHESQLVKYFQSSSLTNFLLENAFSLNNLSEIFSKTKFFINLNPSNHYVVLHALFSGCKVITVDYPLIRSYINNRENGFIIQYPKEIEDILKSDPEIKIEKQNDIDKFNNSWQNILQSTSETIYIK